MGKPKSKKSKKEKTNQKQDERASLRKGVQKASGTESLFPNIEDVTPIVDFLESFQRLADPRAQLPNKLISIRMPIPLLEAFRFKAERAGVPYQVMIKRLMEAWLKQL